MNKSHRERTERQERETNKEYFLKATGNDKITEMENRLEVSKGQEQGGMN